MRLDQSEDAVPVALSIRTLEGDPDNSLPVQLMTLQRYARSRRLDPVRIFFDIQGGRSQLEVMLAEATREHPPFRRVLVHDEERLSGEAGGQGDMRARLEGAGVMVVFVTDPR